VEYSPLIALPVKRRTCELEELIVAPDSTVIIPPVEVMVYELRLTVAPDLISRVTPIGIDKFPDKDCVPERTEIKLPLVIPLSALLIVSQSRPAGSPSPTGRYAGLIL
jgi:hypothetical protein